ncbi:MAG: SPOR domain-containing protein [Rhodocyclaceae bacterium]|nr:SPOR domain-containing protein [Rhodocyclaceae bacterium]
MTENTAAPDSDLQLKKRARRRLVGAVALALLAAIVLPMVMDHEPRPAQQDIQVRIPSQDAGSFTSRVLPGAPTATPLPPVAEARKPEPTPELKPELKPEAALEPVAPAKVEIRPEPKPVEAKPVIKPELPRHDAKPDAKTAEALRAEKILAGGDAPKAEAPKSDHDQWVLQLGAYAEQGNVKVLQGKIKELGYPSYTEKVTTPQGERIRVRAGPFSSKAAAEKAQARLKQIGAGGPPGGVVAPK